MTATDEPVGLVVLVASLEQEVNAVIQVIVTEEKQSGRERGFCENTKKQISSGKRTTKIFNFLPGHQEVMKNHYKASLNTCNSSHHCIKMHQHKTKYVHKGIVHDVSHCGTVHVKPNTHHSLEHNAFNHRSHCIIGT